VCVCPGGGPGGKYGARAGAVELRKLFVDSERPERSQWRRVVFDPLLWTLKSRRNATNEVACEGDVCENGRPRVGAFVNPI